MTLKATAALADLYHCLAEALAEPISWFAQAGRRWPLFAAALAVAHETNDAALNEALSGMAALAPESVVLRRKRYRDLQSDGAQSGLYLHESLARDGRIAGGLTFRIGALYQSAGLAVAGTELPDHVAVELGFLAYLVRREIEAESEAWQWHKARALFIKHHAGQWLPALGQALTQSADPVYAPVGQVLTAVMDLESRSRRSSSATKRPVPHLTQPQTCTLCSFCVQVCPTQALMVYETRDTTTLLLDESRCISCRECVGVCPVQTLELKSGQSDQKRRPLYTSPRGCCPGCGEPTVSEAELEAIAETIGAHDWLKYCSDCRPLMMEVMR